MRSVYRSFSPDSIWNRPLPLEGCTHPESDTYIAWMKANLTNDYLTLGDGDWALPVFWATDTDPLVTITPQRGPATTFRLPEAASAMVGNDAALLVIDRTTNQEVQLFEFTREPLGATGIARFYLDSNGLDGTALGADNLGNEGHRGLPGSLHCIRTDEVLAGKVPHRTKFAVGVPGEPSDGHPIWPMTGFESPRSGIIPEGTIMRVRPDYVFPLTLSVPAMVIAYQLQKFGAICGDTAKAGVCTVKLERSDVWDAGVRDCLRDIPWDAYEFVAPGWEQLAPIMRKRRRRARRRRHA